jgi:hypothetical protein
MKGGLIALCRSLVAAHGPENIRVNTVCPGDVETEMVSEFFAFQPDPAAARRAVTERYPLRRFARPADVAAAVAFLASDDACYIAGIDLVVDGGLLARSYEPGPAIAGLDTAGGQEYRQILERSRGMPHQRRRRCPGTRSMTSSSNRS